MYFGDPCYYLVRYVLCSRCVAVSRWVGHYHTFMIATKWYVVTYVLYLLCSSSFSVDVGLLTSSIMGQKLFEIESYKFYTPAIARGFFQKFQFYSWDHQILCEAKMWQLIVIGFTQFVHQIVSVCIWWAKCIGQRPISCHILVLSDRYQPMISLKIACRFEKNKDSNATK